ncbi:putative bifunctional diguanylate cyclase/phosphodiesterase [Hahella ganghwensis]|uniref:putative bifunctional diguanylate cyclase/phosphodiesterase n=1 Tax=Hahella ganghwensis TaxID=286420 RepID=UPI000373FC72|nr:GGDEF and EAL domain-containing protein [Hahella ganghwensis]
MDSQNLLESLLSELDIALFQCESPDDELPNFQLLNEPPSWTSVFQDIARNQPLALTEVFPYLEAFLPEARESWTSTNNSRANSGVWTEVDDEGNNQQLEALALRISGAPILVLLNLTRNFDERHHLYQRAREIALANEKLIVQLNHRQRELQNSLEKRLQDNQALRDIENSVRNNASAVLICKPDGGVEIMNQALIDIYRVKAPEDTNESLLDKWLKEAEKIYPEIHRIVASGSYWEGEFESHNESGESRWIRLAIGPVLDTSHKLTHYVCIANDISMLKKSSAEIEKLADYDFTTHLPNRRHFWKQLTRCLDKGAQKSTSLALIYVDLDHFKRVNDSLGHHAGDFLLSTIGTRLARCIKRGDFIAHLGGDEFAIILELPYPNINIENIAQRVQSAVSKSITIENSTLKMTASIGIALYPRDGRDATSLMRHADLAMFHAKKMGRGKYQTFTPNMNYEFLQMLQLEIDLQKAIEQQQFNLVYQPQVCSGQDHHLRLEALIRWQHPEKGSISPGRFIPIAEENGMILDIGLWVLEHACKQAINLLNEGFNVIMAVNVSAKQVRQENFKDLVKTVLTKTSLPPQHLELEITETTVMEEMDVVVALLKDLRKLGVSISLDDFGSGFSSLTYLKNLPVDYLKLDRAFIHELPANEESKAITTSVINLAHELKIKVIAEGVENQDQVNFLTEKKCDYMQGFLFYYPMEIEKIRDIFTAIRGAANH